MTRTHGSGQACAKSRTVPRCEECKDYVRKRQRTETQTPGTYRHMTVNGIGLPGAKAADRRRRAYRNAADRADAERMEELCRS